MHKNIFPFLSFFLSYFDDRKNSLLFFFLASQETQIHIRGEANLGCGTNYYPIRFSSRCIRFQSKPINEKSKMILLFPYYYFCFIEIQIQQSISPLPKRIRQRPFISAASFIQARFIINLLASLFAAMFFFSHQLFLNSALKHSRNKVSLPLPTSIIWYF